MSVGKSFSERYGTLTALRASSQPFGRGFESHPPLSYGRTSQPIFWPQASHGSAGPRLQAKKGRLAPPSRILNPIP